jgi:hypothetical protein
LIKKIDVVFQNSNDLMTPCINLHSLYIGTDDLFDMDNGKKVQIDAKKKHNLHLVI